MYRSVFGRRSAPHPCPLPEYGGEGSQRESRRLWPFPRLHHRAPVAAPTTAPISIPHGGDRPAADTRPQSSRRGRSRRVRTSSIRTRAAKAQYPLRPGRPPKGTPHPGRRRPGQRPRMPPLAEGTPSRRTPLRRRRAYSSTRMAAAAPSGGQRVNPCRLRVVVEHLHGLEAVGVEVLVDEAELLQHVVGDRDDVAADRVGLEDVEQFAGAGPDQLLGAGTGAASRRRRTSSGRGRGRCRRRGRRRR